MRRRPFARRQGHIIGEPPNLDNALRHVHFLFVVAQDWYPRLNSRASRQGKPVASLVSIEATEIAQKAMERKRAGLVAYLRTFPGDAFERNRAPSRDAEF
jgi:hypothetical protein